MRNQFPLVCAEAIIAHKSQGATLEKIAVHFGCKVSRSLMYVSLSRVTSLQGLYGFGGTFKQSIVHDKDKDEILKEYKRL